MSGIEEGAELRYGRFRGGTPQFWASRRLPQSLGTPQISSPLRTPQTSPQLGAFQAFQFDGNVAVALGRVLAQRIHETWPQTNDAIVLKLSDVAQEQIDGMAVVVSEAEH